MTAQECKTIVNVASVPQHSPFRYPGGKTWLVPRIRQWLGSLPQKPHQLIEPFAGGGIVGSTTAFEDLAQSVLLVELDAQVACVWRTISEDFLTTYDNADGVVELAKKHGFQVQAIPMKNTHHAEMTELLIGRNLDWA